jgi:hypothetical protein
VWAEGRRGEGGVAIALGFRPAADRWSAGLYFCGHQALNSIARSTSEMFAYNLPRAERTTPSVPQPRQPAKSSAQRSLSADANGWAS